MVNAWSLAASVLDGTLDEDYPIMTQTEQKTHSYYDNDGGLHLRQDDFKVEGGDDGSPYDQTYLADNDDQASHHFTDSFDYLMSQTLNNEGQKSESMAHYYKYHEEEILNDIESYVSGTYRGHYTGTTHEYRNVQTIDLMASRDLAADFCQANILKYGSRYGSKDGKNKKDLMKVIHYAMLLLHFDEHYGKPSITSGNIDHNMP
jgi:hypothetical protein